MSVDNEAIALYYSLGPTRFHDLVKFQISRDEYAREPAMILEIDLASKQASEGMLLRLTFRNVHQLKFAPGFWSFSFIDVQALDSSASARFRVFETEQDTEFSLYCEEFEAKVVAAYPESSEE